MLADRQDHKLLEETIAHHELLGGAGDVAVVVQEAHASEASDLDLESHMRGQIDSDLSLARRVSTHVTSTAESSAEALVPDLVNHFS